MLAYLLYTCTLIVFNHKEQISKFICVQATAFKILEHDFATLMKYARWRELDMVENNFVDITDIEILKSMIIVDIGRAGKASNQCLKSFLRRNERTSGFTRCIELFIDVYIIDLS